MRNQWSIDIARNSLTVGQPLHFWLRHTKERKWALRFSIIKMDGDAQKYRALAQVLRERAEDPRLEHDRRDALAMAQRLEYLACEFESDQAASARVPASAAPAPKKKSVLTQALSKIHHPGYAKDSGKNLSFGL